MSPEQRKRLACQFIHRLEEAEKAIREAEELARQLGYDPKYSAADAVLEMKNDAYMEYGKVSFEEDHCPTRKADT